MLSKQLGPALSTGKRMRTNSLLTISILSLSLGFGGVVSCSGNEYSDLVAKCKRIRLGETEEQALKELGPPPNGRQKIELGGRQYYTLNYPAPSLQPTAPSVLIDATTGSVVRVTCSEEYQLLEKR
jgi:hypothetical protein